MSARSTSAWVVVKFGGTSVSTLANWRNIALVVKRRLEKGARVLVVHSAITKITDMLEKLLVAAGAGSPDEALKAIEDRHRQLTTELGVGVSPQLQGYFDELRQMANGIALVRELSDRTRARVMANGELMATEIGSRFLKSQGIDVTWMDARVEGEPVTSRSGKPVEVQCLWVNALETARRIAFLLASGLQNTEESSNG